VFPSNLGKGACLHFSKAEHTKFASELPPHKPTCLYCYNVLKNNNKYSNGEGSNYIIFIPNFVKTGHLLQMTSHAYKHT